MTYHIFYINGIHFTDWRQEETRLTACYIVADNLGVFHKLTTFKTKSFIISILTGTQYNTWPSGLCNCMITIFWEKTKNFADWLYYDNERDVHVPRFQKQWSIQWRQCETGLDKRTQPNLGPDEVDWHVWVGHVSVNNNNSHWNPHSFLLWIDFKKLAQVVTWWPGRPSGSATCIT